MNFYSSVKYSQEAFYHRLFACLGCEKRTFKQLNDQFNYLSSIDDWIQEFIGEVSIVLFY